MFVLSNIHLSSTIHYKLYQLIGLTYNTINKSLLINNMKLIVHQHARVEAVVSKILEVEHLNV